ncbi:hypothetical protein C3L33_00052, partial [Rhododendron williamsianum]
MKTSLMLKKLTSKFEEQLAKDKQQLADDKEQLQRIGTLAKFKEQLAKDEEKLANYKARVDNQMVRACKEREMLTKQLLLLNREKAEVGGESTEFKELRPGKREGNLPATQNPKLELNMLG